MKLKAGKPLVLRYRVVTFDGKLPSATLDRLANQWADADLKYLIFTIGRRCGLPKFRGWLRSRGFRLITD